MTQTTDKPEFTVLSSKASDCRKALYLEMTGAQASNPPDDRGRSLMDLGIAAQQAATNSLKRQGWSVEGMTDAFAIPIKSGGQILVRPRIVAAHPEITEGVNVAVRIVTASSNRFRNWQTSGPLRSHPEAYTDLALMSQIMGSLDVTDPEQPQAFVILNRENGQVEVDPVEAEDLERRAHGVIRRLDEFAKVLASGEEPEAEYTRNSLNCRRCPFLDACHGPAPKRRPKGPLSTQELEDAMETYAEAEDALATTKQFNNPRRKAMDIVKGYLRENKVDSVTVTARGRQWVAKINSGEPKPELNEEKLKEILTDEQRAMVYEDKVPERLSITPLQ